MKTMIDTMSYRGYTGTIEYDEEDDCYFGRVMAPAVSKEYRYYAGCDERELIDSFHDCVDYYDAEKFIKEAEQYEELAL